MLPCLRQRSCKAKSTVCSSRCRRARRSSRRSGKRCTSPRRPRRKRSLRASSRPKSRSCNGGCPYAGLCILYCAAPGGLHPYARLASAASLGAPGEPISRQWMIWASLLDRQSSYPSASIARIPGVHMQKLYRVFNLALAVVSRSLRTDETLNVPSSRRP